jgi:hypothetical protein
VIIFGDAATGATGATTFGGAAIGAAMTFGGDTATGGAIRGSLHTRTGSTILQTGSSSSFVLLSRIRVTNSVKDTILYRIVSAYFKSNSLFFS